MSGTEYPGARPTNEGEAPGAICAVPRSRTRWLPAAAVDSPLAVGASAALLALLIIILFPLRLVPPQQLGAPDSISYYAIAQGHHHSAYYYYAGRILHPITARATAELLAVGMPSAFAIVSELSLVIFFVALSLNVADLCFVPMLFAAVVVVAYRVYYLPDLYYAALTAIFFIVMRANAWLSLPVLLLLYLTRESTILLVGAFALVMLMRRDFKLALAVAIVAFIGLRLNAELVSQGLPSKHGISGLGFDLLKVIYNIAANFFGAVVWTDTNASTEGCVPLWTLAIHFGLIRKIGLCQLDWVRPLLTLTSLLATFGAMPLLLLYRRTRPARPDLSVALCYGLISFGLAPLIGGTVSRYVLYSWPLFWLYGAELFKPLAAADKLIVAGFSLVLSWIPFFLNPLAAFLATAAVGVVAWIALDRRRIIGFSTTSLSWRFTK